MKIKLFSTLLFLALLALLPNYSTLESREPREHRNCQHRSRSNFSVNFNAPRPIPQVYAVQTRPVYAERVYVRPNRPYYYSEPTVVYQEPVVYYEEVVPYYQDVLVYSPPVIRPQSLFSFSWVFGR